MSENTVKTENNRGGKPFTKDDPRINRNGRPKGSFSLVEMIKNKLQEIPEGKDKTYAEYFIEQMMKKTVVEGDVSMMKDMINRVDGMPKQSIGLQGELRVNGAVDDKEFDALMAGYAKRKESSSPEETL